jgi:sugar phosphate permease
MSYVSKTLMDIGLLDFDKWGLLVSYGAIVYGLSKGLSGALADKFDLKKILLFGLGATSIINFIVPSLKSSVAIIVIWVINQFVQGMAYTSCVKTLLNWFGPGKKNKAYTYWSASHRLGTSVAGIIATGCIAARAWQGAFIVPAAITGVMFVFIGLFYKQRPDNFVQLKNHEILQPTFKEICKYIFTNRNLLVLAITSMGIYYAYFFILNFMLIFFTERGGFSITKSTGLLSLLPLLGCFGGITSGYVVDGVFKGRILPVIAIPLIVIIILLAFLYFGVTTLSITWLIFLMLLLGFFTDIPQILGSLASTNFVTKRFQGSALGFVGICHYTGVTLMGFLTARTKPYGWGVPFIITIAFILFSLLGCVVLFNQEKIALKKNREM